LTVPNAILFRKARELAGYVWNGEGGDPCFGGPKNLPMLLAELYGDGQNDTDETSPRARSYYRAHLKCFDELPSLLTEEALAVLTDAPLESEVNPYFEGDRSFVGALSEINVIWKGGHHILPKVDQLARAAGVQPRSPLFSKNVVELASRLPPSLKLRGSVEKYALKEAVRDILPAAIVDRAKSGMMVPVEGHYEQYCNAVDAGKMGAGIHSRQFKLEKLIAFLPFYNQSPLYFQQWVNEAEKKIMSAINSLYPTDPDTRISILQQAG